MAKDKPQANQGYDAVFLCKILFYLILGTCWLAFSNHRFVPLGMIIGVVAAHHERMQLDRKLDYVMLIVGAVLGLMGLGLTVYV